MKNLKKLAIALLCFGAITYVSSQTVIYHEDFELPTAGDSVISSGNPGWAINTNLYFNGLQSDSSYVALSDTTMLTTSSFSTIGYYFVLLEFSHICKIEFIDNAIIEVSNDNGATWAKATASQYLGSGQFGSQGDKFSSVSYITDWQAANNYAIPTNSWWKTEQFNISSLVSNASQVKVRFVLSDGNSNGSGFNYGWLIDDISITVAYSELIPPTITLNPPVLGDTVYNTGPFTVSSDIIDASGVDTAFLVYTVNGQNPDTLGMLNTSGNTYIADIPSFTYGNIIGYYIVAIDISPAANVGRYPAAGIDTFLVLQGPSVVEIGTGLLYTYYIPTYGNYDYGWSSIIYKNSEINKGGLIDSISFYVENAVTGYQMNNQKVYMANVPYSTYANANRPDTSSMTLVFSGTMAWNGPGWQKIPLQIPFGYNGNDNLLIYYENRDGSGATGYPRFRYTTTSPEQLTKYRIQNISFPTTPGSFYYYRPNIRIAFSPSNFTHDAGISQIIQPQPGIVLSNTLLPVEVVVKNYGIDTLTKATLGWSIDGTVKNTTNWTGNLLQDVVSTPVVIGIDSFNVGSHQIKTWTSMPNDSTDNNNYNDTTYVNFYACSSILNGVYTIGGPTADFPTINDALENLNICGLSGSVVFNINSGTYVTQFEISDIPGTSDTNTITFQSATGNHDDVIITFDSVDYSNNYILKLNGAKHFRFKNITFKATNNTYGKVIELAGSTKDNRFIGNKFESLIGTSTSTYFVLVNSMSGTSNIDSLSVFDSNTFIGGSYGMYLYGNNGAPEDSIIITNNHFIDQYSRAIQAYYQKSSQIIGNTITSNNYSLYYGMYFYNCSNNMRILKNKITLTNSPNQAYGIYLTGSNGIQGNEILIANNFLVLASNYRAIGLFLSSCNYINTYHNSIDMIIADQNWEVRTVNLQGTSTNLDFRNNIFANSGGGLTLVVFMSTGVTSDYNVLYTTGANIGAWGSPTAFVQPNITAWRNTTSQDYNSLAVNPKFYSATNLHTQNPAINNLGTGLFMVTEDIDGDARSTTNPDMGADEFTIYPDDAGIVSITAPSIASCGLSANENVTVKIKNFGSDTITTCNVAYVLNNATPVNETVSASINPNTVHTYTFSTKANLSAAGNHTITCYTNLTGDSYHVNDSVINYTVINSHDFTSGPFTLGFEVNENIDGWNSHDNNGDGHTWEFPYNNPINSKTGLNCARFVSDSAHNGNDWLVSRCFYLQTGTAYKVSFSYKIASALYPHSLEVKLGTTLNPVFLNTMLIKKDTITNDNYNDIFTVFTVPSNGIYYIGWHAISPATGIGTNFDLFIDDIIIELAPTADAEMLSFVSPNGGCGLGNENVEIQVRNLGSSAISGNITANYQIVGSSSIVTENIIASIAPGDTLNYIFTTTASLSVLTADSIFNLLCWVNLSGDIDQNNDTLRKSIISKYKPADPIANNITSPYAQSATIIAISPDTLFWFDVPVGGAEIGAGPTFTTPVLYDTTTFYVEARAGSPEIKFTEVSQYHGLGAGATNPAPSWLIGDDFVEITNLGGAAVDLSGYTYHREGSSTYYYITYNIPSGVVLGPNEVLVLATYGATTDDPSNNFYVAGSYSLSSSTQSGHYLSDPVGTIIDAVSVSGYQFTPASGVTAMDWTGNIPSSSGRAGIIRIVSDNNDASDWVLSDNPSPVQTLGSVNPGLQIGASGIGCTSSRVPVDVYVTGIPQFDISPVELVEPVSGIDLTNTETVKVKIKNYGISSVSGFNAGYSVDGGGPVIETVNSTINGGDEYIYTFAATANLSNYTTYNIKTFTSLTGDITIANDTISTPVENSMLTYCISQAISIDHLDIGRVRIVNVFDHGNNLPLYNNPSAIKTYSDFTNLPPILLSQGNGYTMFVFKIHPTTGTYSCYINVFIDYNMDGVFDMNTERVVGKALGGTQTLAVMSLNIPSNVPSSNTRMRIIMKEGGNEINTLPCGTYTYGETHDYNVIIVPKIPFDAGISEIIKPSLVADEGSSSPIEVVVQNYGINSLNTLDISYIINGGSPVTKVWTGYLAAGECDTVQLSNFIVPAGLTNIKVFTDLQFDNNTVNDYRVKQITGLVTINLPWYDDIEGPDYWISKDSIGLNQWERGDPSGSTINTPHSPVNVWMTNLTGNYMNNSFDNLYTPKISFSQVSGANLSFWHYYNSGSEDGGRIQYSNNGGITWITLGWVNDTAGTNWYNTMTSMAANIWSGNSNGWIQSTYNLSQFNNSPLPIQFRFNFISDGSGNSSDGWAIDDVQITLPPVPKDASPVSLLEPSTATAIGSSVQVKATIKNLGTTSITSMNLGYSINGGASIIENWTGSLASNTTTDYTFIATYISPSSNYKLCIFCDLTGDAYNFNDTLCNVINIAPAVHDGGISEIIEPTAFTTPNSQITVKVTIKNYGTDPITSLDVSYYSGSSAAVTEPWSGLLNQYQTANFTFTATYTSPVGNYDVCAYTTLANDPNPVNDELCVNVTGGVGIDEEGYEGFILHQSIPNPANNQVTFIYQLPDKGNIIFKVINVPGQTVYQLNENKNAGEHKIKLDIHKWDQGIYFYSVEFKKKRQTRKMVVVK